MRWEIYLRLVLETAGTLLALFLMILIVGYRRRRTFERALFFLALALFFYYAGILLMENAWLYYGSGIPAGTKLVYELLVSIAVAPLPGLLVHVHFAYWWAQSGVTRRWWNGAIIAVAYMPCVYFGVLIPKQIFFIGDASGFPFPGGVHARPYLLWLTASIILCVALQIVFARRSAIAGQRGFHNFLAVYFAGVGLLAVHILLFNTFLSNGNVMWNFSSANTLDYLIVAGTVYAWIIPLALMVYVIVRYRALGIGSQKNLVYSVSIAFLAILYLSLVRRLSGWLEPILPPEATSAILLFVLVAFFEPLQRVASRLLRRRFQEQVDQLQHLRSDLQREALRGELGPFLAFAEERVRQEFGLEEVRIHLNDSSSVSGQQTEQQAKADVTSRPGWFGQPVRLPIGKQGAEIGGIIALPIGSAISGETMAALEFFAEQLPSTIELCRVIHQKVELERELDERERLAMLGQMTASISHNLKNPLGSMKTLLQVQLENPNLPDATRKDLAMVLSELDRLSVKLNQLLKYSRPLVRSGGAVTTRVNVGAVAEQTVLLLRHEAERRQGKLALSDLSGGALVNGAEEALADVISNLVVNAVEAMRAGGSASVELAREGSDAVISVADDGPGVPAELLATIFQPFFTTKPSGTGLGLAIVERRVTELGGTVKCESPIAGERGARFVVRLPIATPANDERA